MLRSLDRGLSGIARNLAGASRSFAVKPIKGRATTSGTMKFMRQSQLPLYHQFHKSQLFVNPIIHGAPKKLYALDDKDRVYIEALTRRAVLVNRSNCVVIYKHHEEGEPWYSTNLSALFNDVSREQIVTVAHLGFATTKEEVFRRLAKACEITGLQTIDMALVEINEAVKPSLVEGSIAALDELCANGQLQSFGFQVSVAPYVYHTPALKQTGPQMMMPMNLESGLAKATYADLVAYPICPTTHIPATYPLLDADLPGASKSDEEGQGQGLGAGSDDDESKRTFTRAAVNPLSCRFGGNAVLLYEPPEAMKARGIRTRPPGDIEARKREMARRRERRARQAAEGVQAQLEQEVLVQTLDRLRKCKVFSREDCERVIYELAEAEAAGASRKELSDYRNELAQLAAMAERGELTEKDEEGGAAEGGAAEGSSGGEAKEAAEAAPEAEAEAEAVLQDEGTAIITDGASLDDVSEDEFSDAEDPELGEEVPLLSGLRDLESEDHMGASLDRMCPALASSPRLQDKALRVAFSVGVDVAIVDAELSAMMGKLALRPEDMLSHRETEGVFGRFCVAYDKEQEDSDNAVADDQQGEEGGAIEGSNSHQEGAAASANAGRAKRLLAKRSATRSTPRRPE